MIVTTSTVSYSVMPLLRPTLTLMAVLFVALLVVAMVRPRK